MPPVSTWAPMRGTPCPIMAPRLNDDASPTEEVGISTHAPPSGAVSDPSPDGTERVHASGAASSPVAARPIALPDTRDVPALTRAVAAGDEAAFTRLYEAWFEWSLTAARRASGRDESWCLDVVQDAWLRVVRGLPPLPSDAAFAVWLRRTVERCCLDRLRAERRRRRHEAQLDPPAPATEESPSTSTVQTALEELPADHLELLAARFARGWTLARIGDALGLRPGAVDGRLSRVLVALRRRLDDA